MRLAYQGYEKEAHVEVGEGPLGRHVGCGRLPPNIARQEKERFFVISAYDTPKYTYDATRNVFHKFPKNNTITGGARDKADGVSLSCQMCGKYEYDDDPTRRVFCVVRVVFAFVNLCRMTKTIGPRDARQFAFVSVSGPLRVALSKNIAL